MQQFLKDKTQAWRTEKHTAPRANTRAVVQDARLTLESITNEAGHRLLLCTANTHLIPKLMALCKCVMHLLSHYDTSRECNLFTNPKAKIL